MPDESTAVVKQVKNDKQLAKLLNEAVLANAPEVISEFFIQLVKRMKVGDMKAMEIAAEMLRLKKQSGVSINVQQNNNTQVNNGGSARDRTSEAIIRRLERRNTDRSADVQDAEFVDVNANQESPANVG